MRDRGHELTDELLEEMEKKIRKEYRQAVKDTQAKLDDYLRRFQVKDEIWRQNVAEGKKTAEEYKKWRMGQIMVGKRWEEMRDTLAQDLHNANAVARSVIEGYRPEVYAINHNFATYEVEMGAKLDTSYTLYNRQAVERIMRENPDLLPPPGRKMKASLAAGKDIVWQEGQIQSVTMQSILQGESIPNMAKRIAETMGEINHKATIRYARTAVTGAENAGRKDAFERAERMGIDMEQEWRATLDMRTRHSHRQLDGERRPVGEAFSNGCEYPGDPNGPAEEIWNCRCSIRGIVAGLEPQARKYRSLEDLEGMSYEEWRESKVEKPHRITKQEEIAEIMRRKYIREDYGGGRPGGGQEKNQEHPQPAPKKPADIKEANRAAEDMLGGLYERHRIDNDLRVVPLEELKAAGQRIVSAEFGNMSVESADVFTRTLSGLAEQYDTPLKSIRPVTKAEFMQYHNAFAAVTHDYTTDSANLIINVSKCKDMERLTKRIAELADDGYCIAVKKGLESQYVATHEFAHTLINLEQPLKNKTNWVGADYGKIKSARKEIKAIFADYTEEVRQLTVPVKELESKAFDAIIEGDIQKGEALQKQFFAAEEKLKAVKLGEYSLSNADEFMAEAFTNEKIGAKSNPYAKRVVEVLDRYFGRE